MLRWLLKACPIPHCGGDLFCDLLEVEVWQCFACSRSFARSELETRWQANRDATLSAPPSE